MQPNATTPIPMPNYPNQILPQFDSLDFYQRLAPETLFFIFYYMEVIYFYFPTVFDILPIIGYQSAVNGSQDLKKSILAISHKVYDVVSKARRAETDHRRI